MKGGYKIASIVEIPEDWELIPIYELRNKKDRYSFTGGPFGSDLKSEHYTSSGVRIIQLQDIGEGEFLNKSQVYTTEDKADQLISCNIYPGEIILAKMAPVARCCKIPNMAQRFLMCSDGIRLSVDTMHYNNEFVYQALNSEYFRREAESQSTGTTRARIGLNDLKLIPIAVPQTLFEQEKIAQILSAVDEKIEVIGEQILQTIELKKGLMQQLLTRGIGHTQFKASPLGEIPVSWDVELLDSVAKRGSGHTPSKNHPEYYNGDIKWISLSDSYKLDNRWITETRTTITLQGIDNSSAVLHPGGTVLLSRDAGIGKSAVMGEPMAVSQHFITWTCSDCLNNWYLYYLLQFNKPLFERIAIGSTIKTIGLPFFKKFRIPVPPIEEQNKISEFLYAIDDKLDALSTKKDLYQDLKKGLMQQLLTGKIRVNQTNQSDDPTKSQHLQTAEADV